MLLNEHRFPIRETVDYIFCQKSRFTQKLLSIPIRSIWSSVKMAQYTTNDPGLSFLPTDTLLAMYKNLDVASVYNLYFTSQLFNNL